MKLQETVVQTLAIGFLFCSCAGNQNRFGATISLQETKVKIGHEIGLRVEHVPDGWWGEINVNHVRHFPIDAKRHAVIVRGLVRLEKRAAAVTP